MSSSTVSTCAQRTMDAEGALESAVIEIECTLLADGSEKQGFMTIGRPYHRHSPKSLPVRITDDGPRLECARIDAGSSGAGLVLARQPCGQRKRQPGGAGSLPAARLAIPRRHCRLHSHCVDPWPGRTSDAAAHVCIRLHGQ